VTSQGCIYSTTGGNTAFDGTFAGSYTITVTTYNFDGTVFATQTQTGPIGVVIVNGSVTVNGSPSSGSVTPAGGISFNASGSVGDCQYTGSVTSAGGGGSVHCGVPGLYVADGTWTLSRVGP